MSCKHDGKVRKGKCTFSPWRIKDYQKRKIQVKKKKNNIQSKQIFIQKFSLLKDEKKGSRIQF